MQQDLEQYILNVLALNKKEGGPPIDYMITGEKPDKVRLIFKNTVEPPINFGEWTIITMPIKSFPNLCGLYNQALKDWTKGKQE
jgi:hypothetical protein